MKPSVVLVLPVLVCALSSCGGEPSKSAATTTSTATPTATATAPGGTAPSFAAVDLPDQPGPLVELIGTKVRAAGAVHAEITTEGGGGDKAAADLRTDTPQPTLRMTIQDTQPTHAVVLDGVVYVRTEGGEIEPGRPWARLARADIPAEPPELKRMLTSLLDGVDSALRDLSTDTGLDLVEKGSFKGEPVAVDLEGEPVRRYDGATEASKLTEEKYKGSAQVTWSLWVGPDGLPRRFTAQLKSAATSVTYSRWGVPITVEAPPANQVASLTS